ncbi:C25 family cysteine peptidase [Rubritalea tangerina]|uniref:C25 family cysteine peptidase n=1 Tax=Rubritalea tangerina TaxID=430798 RepID=A0ABW4ZDS6_9BACT
MHTYHLTLAMLGICAIAPTPISADDRIPAAFGERVAEPARFQNISPKDKAVSNGKDGYLIVTTNDLTHKLKALQPFITNKVENRGFNVYLATENDWSGKSEAGARARERGAFPGRVHGLDILDYLKQNYENLGVKYVLFIGDSRPDEGTVPMLRIRHSQKYKNFFRETDPKKLASPKMQKVQKMARKEDKQYVEWGEVVSDYPFVDLGTDWDAEKLGFLDASKDPNPEATLEPEVFVGRIPYYGEESEWGKAEDIDVILKRIIRYDNEEDIAWRYHYVHEYGKEMEIPRFLNERGINYTLVTSGHRAASVGMPSVPARDGSESPSNFEIIQDFGVGFMNTHSHGGPMGMSGLRSVDLANKAHDKWPTVLTLGACDIGQIQHPKNLVYTALRFHSVAVSGGTGSVTGYGGDQRYAAQNRLTKHDLLFDGKSVGEAHWGWYGALYRKTRVVPMTGAKINIYGDPSVVPLRHGPVPPYPFFARPVTGFFKVLRQDERPDASTKVRIAFENAEAKALTVKVEVTEPWLKAKQAEVALQANGKASLELQLDQEAFAKMVPGRYEARVRLSDDSGYLCERRYVLKVPEPKMRALYTFDKGGNTIPNLLGSKHAHRAQLHLPKSVTKWNGQGDKPVAYVDGHVQRGNNAAFPAEGYIYPFEEDDFTIASWFQLEGKSVSPKKPITLMYGRDFFNLQRTASGIKLTVNAHGSKEVKTLEAAVQWSAGKWHHVAFGLDQMAGKLVLFFDGKQVAETKVRAMQTYAASRFGFGRFEGVVDDFMVHSALLPEKQLAQYKDGFYAVRPLPADQASGIAASEVHFNFVAGRALEGAEIILREAGKPKTMQRIKPDELGAYVAYQLKPETEYEWRVLGDSHKGATWSFRTTEEWLPNPSFAKTREGWKGNARYVRPQKRHAISLRERWETVTTKPMQADKLYTLRAQLTGHGYEVEAFYMDGSKKVVLAEKSGNGDLELHILSKSGGKQVGKPLHLNFKRREGARFADLYHASLTEAEPGSVNMAPIAKEALASFRPKVKVGHVGWQFPLDELVEDPEGQALTFEVLSGPSWAYVQDGNTFFTNYGPERENRGENTFRVQAKDTKGASYEFYLTVDVE